MRLPGRRHCYLLPNWWLVWTCPLAMPCQVPEESQLVFRSSAAAVESCALLSPSAFLTGCDDGSVALWSAQKKKPAHIFRGAHGAGPSHLSSAGPSTSGHAMANGTAGHTAEGSDGGMAAHWVGAVAACRGSDLAASGAGDGVVKLWHCDLSRFKLRPLAALPTVCIVTRLFTALSLCT